MLPTTNHRLMVIHVGQTICHCVPVASDSSIFHCCVHRPPAGMLFGQCHLRHHEHCDCSNLHHSHCLSVACILSCCSYPLFPPRACGSCGNFLFPTHSCCSIQWHLPFSQFVKFVCCHQHFTVIFISSEAPIISLAWHDESVTFLERHHKIILFKTCDCCTCRSLNLSQSCIQCSSVSF